MHKSGVSFFFKLGLSAAYQIEEEVGDTVICSRILWHNFIKRGCLFLLPQKAKQQEKNKRNVQKSTVPIFLQTGTAWGCTK